MRSFTQFFKFGLFTGFFLLFWGCIEYTITTQVMPDGRILRTISVKGDSASVFRGSFRVPSDSSWTIITRYEKDEKDSSGSKVYVYEAMKEFANASELNSYFYIDSGVKNHIVTQVDLVKKSKWFYTYFTYTETYSRLFPFKSVPINSYLTDSEIRIWHAGDHVFYSPATDSLVIITDSVAHPSLNQRDSLRFKQLRDSLEYKFELWQKINIYNDFYLEVSKALGKMGKISDTVNARIPFYECLDSIHVLDEVMQNYDAFIGAASTFFKIDSASLKAANYRGFEDFNQKFRISALTLESYVNQVLMPGIILNANSHDITGNLVIWKIEINDFYATDFSMSVTSKTINRHAVTIAAVLLVVLTGLLLLRLFRKQKTPA